jgi:hypothetical protein
LTIHPRWAVEENAYVVGKPTTMRMLIGLDRPDAGHAAVNGKLYRELRLPLREVGAMLEARAFHPGRSARAHLRALAVSNAIPGCEVAQTADELIVIGQGRLLAHTTAAELSATASSPEYAT